jgi:hypothetical protein
MATLVNKSFEGSVARFIKPVKYKFYFCKKLTGILIIINNITDICKDKNKNTNQSYRC